MALRIIAVLFSAFFAGSSPASGGEDWGDLKTVAEIVNIREHRSTQSRIVGKLYPGDTAKTDFLHKGWVAVFLVDEAVRDEGRALGYVYAQLIQPATDISETQNAANPNETDESPHTLSDAYCQFESGFDLPRLKEILPHHSRISKPHTDDLPGILKRRTLRILTTYSLSNYFIHEGRSFGFEYSLLKDYGRFLNHIKSEADLKVVVEFFPLPQEQLVPSLVGGLGDIVAAGLSVTPQLDHQVDFTVPYLKGIREVMISHKDVKGIQSLHDLDGRQIYVRPILSHYKSLERLNDRLLDMNLRPLRILRAERFLKPIDVFEMLNAGIVDLSITESHLCDLWVGIFPNLRVLHQVPLSSKCEIAWMIRKNNPELKASLNRFIKGHKKGTLHGNIYYRRYFKDSQWITNPLNTNDHARFSRFAPLFKKYGSKYGFDWMLIAAVAYQESGLNPQSISPEGALGMMQVMPATAKDPRINIPNLRWLENNVHAGTKYLALLRDTYFSDAGISAREKTYFVLAAYNAGPRNIRIARSATKAMGYDPNKWFHHSELGALKNLGQETVRFVSNVNKYYLAYSLAATLDCLRKRNTTKVGKLHDNSNGD